MSVIKVTNKTTFELSESNASVAKWNLAPSIRPPINAGFTQSISSLRPDQNEWVIKACVIRKDKIMQWNGTKTAVKYFLMKLKDESGEISCTVADEQCDRYFENIEVHREYIVSNGKVVRSKKSNTSLKNDYNYKIRFTEETEVHPADTKGRDILKVGKCKTVGELQTINSKTTKRKAQKCDNKIIKKRKQSNPSRKWTENEQKLLLEFLKVNGTSAKPTSEVFYKRFLNEAGLQMEWKCVQCKVNNFRASYREAIKVQESIKEGEPIKDVILKKCPFFDALDEMFSNKNIRIPDIIGETENGSLKTSIQSQSSGKVISSNSVVPGGSVELVGEVNSPEETHLEPVLEVHSSALQARERRHYTMLPSDLTQEYLNFEKEKHWKESELKLREIESHEKLERLKIELEREKMLRDFEVKERIALQDRESQERLAKYAFLE